MSMSTMGTNAEIPIPAGWAGTVDCKLSLDSEQPVRNKTITEALQIIDHDIERLLALRADFTKAGLVKLTDATDATETAGLALPATEKNAAVPGSLANKIGKVTQERFYWIVLEHFPSPVCVDALDASYVEKRCGVVHLQLVAHVAEELPANKVFLSLNEDYQPERAVRSWMVCDGRTIGMYIYPAGGIVFDSSIPPGGWVYINQTFLARI